MQKGTYVKEMHERRYSDNSRDSNALTRCFNNFHYDVDRFIVTQEDNTAKAVCAETSLKI